MEALLIFEYEMTVHGSLRTFSIVYLVSKQKLQYELCFFFRIMKFKNLEINLLRANFSHVAFHQWICLSNSSFMNENVTVVCIYKFENDENNGLLDASIFFCLYHLVKKLLEILSQFAYEKYYADEIYASF